MNHYAGDIIRIFVSRDLSRGRMKPVALTLASLISFVSLVPVVSVSAARSGT